VLDVLAIEVAKRIEEGDGGKDISPFKDDNP
jgi:hypothetical protein